MQRLKAIFKRVFSVWCVTHSIMLIIFLSGFYTDSSAKLEITDVIYKNGSIEVFAKNSGGSKVAGPYQFSMLINSKDTFQVDVAEKLIPGKGEITKIASVPEARLRVNKSQELQTISRLGWFKSEDNKKLNDLDVFKKNIIVK